MNGVFIRNDRSIGESFRNLDDVNPENFRSFTAEYTAASRNFYSNCCDEMISGTKIDTHQASRYMGCINVYYSARLPFISDRLSRLFTIHYPHFSSKYNFSKVNFYVRIATKYVVRDNQIGEIRTGDTLNILLIG